MDNKSLSQLTKDYSAGEIGEREYREMRSKLIQEIVSGNVVLEKNKYTKPSAPVKKSRKKTRIIINLENKRPLAIAICVLCIIVIILIIGILAFQ